jgi:cell division protein FtsL
MMNNNKEQSIKNFTRGGQIILHNTRMFTQIMSWLSLSCLLIFAVSTISIIFLQLTHYERYMLMQWTEATVSIKIFGKKSTQQVQLPNGVRKKILSTDIVNSQRVQLTVNKATTALMIGIVAGLIISLSYFFIIYRFLRKQGEVQSETKQIRGDTFVENKELKKMIEQSKDVSDIKIADLPMPKNFECRHTLLHGSNGTGKSELIKRMLDQIRDRDEKYNR